MGAFGGEFAGEPGVRAGGAGVGAVGAGGGGRAEREGEGGFGVAADLAFEAGTVVSGIRGVVSFSRGLRDVFLFHNVDSGLRKLFQSTVYAFLKSLESFIAVLFSLLGMAWPLPRCRESDVGSFSFALDPDVPV